MVDIYIYIIVNGVIKPLIIGGAPHCRNQPIKMPNSDRDVDMTYEFSVLGALQ